MGKAQNQEGILKNKSDCIPAHGNSLDIKLPAGCKSSHDLGHHLRNMSLQNASACFAITMLRCRSPEKLPFCCKLRAKATITHVECGPGTTSTGIHGMKPGSVPKYPEMIIGLFSRDGFGVQYHWDKPMNG